MGSGCPRYSRLVGCIGNARRDRAGSGLSAIARSRWGARLAAMEVRTGCWAVAADCDNTLETGI